MKGTMMDYQIDGKNISIQDVDSSKPAWRVLLNGEDITERVLNLGVVNEQLGMGFLYGRSATGGAYNQGHFYNRGGAVILIQVMRGNEHFIAVLEQVRPLQKSEPILECPRGQANLGENGIETALRELLEETGIGRESIYEIVDLGSGNPDNALTLGENVHFVLMSIQETDIDWELMKIRDDTFSPDTRSRLSEQIKGSRIVALKGFHSPSMMTMSAVGIYRSYLDLRPQGPSGPFFRNVYWGSKEEEEEQ